jgi:RNA polymerase sigma factor (sigma-70 family)
MHYGLRAVDAGARPLADERRRSAARSRRSGRTPRPDSIVTAGDSVSDALEGVLARFGTLVQAVAWRHGLDGHDVDEVLQEVRFRIWRAHASSASISAAPASYVYRTAVSAALDLLRQRKRAGGGRAGHTIDSRTLDELDALECRLPDGGDPARMLDAAELARAVEMAVTRIPASRQAVVRMYLIGHPLAEIAQLVRGPEPKTRSLLYRGLASVRRDLAAQGYGPTGVA